MSDPLLDGPKKLEVVGPSAVLFVPLGHPMVTDYVYLGGVLLCMHRGEVIGW